MTTISFYRPSSSLSLPPSLQLLPLTTLTPLFLDRPRVGNTARVSLNAALDDHNKSHSIGPPTLAPLPPQVYPLLLSSLTYLV